MRTALTEEFQYWLWKIVTGFMGRTLPRAGTACRARHGKRLQRSASRGLLLTIEVARIGDHRDLGSQTCVEPRLRRCPIGGERVVVGDQRAHNARPAARLCQVEGLVDPRLRRRDEILREVLERAT